MSRIMVVDDQADVRLSIRKILELDGHAVIEEPNAKSALRHFAGDPVDLVISDVYMPEMDGIEFLMRVREVFLQAKIIMMSGGGNMSKADALTNASMLGADRILEKPFTVQEMQTAVRAVLAGG